LIKLFTVDLIDKDGNTITGNLFGDRAFDKYSSIKNGKVYRISRGKVIEDKYSPRKK
jgi:hypothetical protein